MDKKFKCFSCGGPVVTTNCKVQVVVTEIGVFYFCAECFDKMFPYVKKAMQTLGFKGMKDIPGENEVKTK